MSSDQPGGVADLDPRRLSNKVAVVVASKVATALIELAIVVVLVRILVKEDVAIVTFLLVVYQLGRNLAALGLPESVFYFYERIAPEARRAFVVRTGLVLGAAGLAAGLFIALMSLTTSWLLSDWHQDAQDTVATALPILALAVVMELPTKMVGNVLLVSNRVRQSAWYSILMSVGVFVALLGPLAVDLGIVAACWSLVVFTGFRLAVSFVWTAAVVPAGRGRLEPGLLGQQLRFSWPLALNSMAMRLSKYADRIVVAVMLPAAALAEYHVGAQEIPFIPVIAYGVGAVLISRYVSFELKGDYESLRELWLMGIRGVSLLVIPSAVILLVVAEDLILLLFGADYLAAVIPFQLYTLLLLVRVAQYGSMLQTFGDTRSILRITLTSLTINIALNIPLTHFFGISGTAFATVVATYIAVYTYLRRIAHHLDKPLKEVVPLAHYLRVLGLASALALGAYALRHLAFSDLSPGLAMALTLATFALAYASVGRAIGLITAEHMAILRGWLRLNFLYSEG